MKKNKERNYGHEKELGQSCVYQKVHFSIDFNIQAYITYSVMGVDNYGTTDCQKNLLRNMKNSKSAFSIL
jgi:hypothetical protein